MSVGFRAQGKKRDLTEDETASVVCLKKSRYTPPLNNKFHLQGCAANKIGLLIAVREMFPTLDEKTVATVLERYGDNVEEAIEKLERLQLSGQMDESIPQRSESSRVADRNEGSSSQTDQKLSEQWLGPFLHEISLAKDSQDVKQRLARLLAAYEDAVVENYKQNSSEIKTAKAEFERLKKQNAILAQAVSLQHEKLKQETTKEEDLQKLRQVVLQYEDRIRKLELTNYSLTMHLEKAVGHKFSEHGPPDIC